ncbi:hypothetical protein TRVL_06216 [Trypanosoma vivax]|nr:hypothetical protein TRVL_06216 [Trypanosoma vivax]
MCFGGAGITLLCCIAAFMLILLNKQCLRRKTLFYATTLIVTSFLNSVLCAVLLTLGYFKGYCQDDPMLKVSFAPFEEQEYKLWYGFYCICTTVGLLLMSVCLLICSLKQVKSKQDNARSFSG